MASRTFELVKEFLRPDSGADRSLPPMDGGYTPNDDLDRFEGLCSLVDVQDVLAVDHRRAVVTAGRALWLVDVFDISAKCLVEFDGQATGMDRLGDEVLVAVTGQGLYAWHLRNEALREIALSARGPLSNLSAVAAVGSRIFVTCPSAEHGWVDWPRDLMNKRSSGGLFELRDDGTMETLISGLAWPFGLCASPDMLSLFYTESWSHRLARYDLASGTRTAVTDRLPGYPARVRFTREGTLLLAMFALRNQLVEFVLRRDRYRGRMLAEIPVEDWICPSYRSTLSVRQPMQLGAAVHLGEIKPWAPALSYGLVAELTPQGVALVSYQARAGATRHGVTSACEVGDRLLVACRGNDELLLGRGVGEEHSHDQ